MSYLTRIVLAIALVILCAPPAFAQFEIFAREGSLVVEPQSRDWCGEYARLRIRDLSGASVVAESGATVRAITAARFAVQEYCPAARIIEVYTTVGDRVIRIWRAEAATNWAWRLTAPTRMAQARDTNDQNGVRQKPRNQGRWNEAADRTRTPPPAPAVTPPPAVRPPAVPQPSGGSFRFDWIDVALIIGAIIVAILIDRATGAVRLILKVLFEIFMAIFSDRHRV